MMSLFK